MVSLTPLLLLPLPLLWETNASIVHMLATKQTLNIGRGTMGYGVWGYVMEALVPVL